MSTNFSENSENKKSEYYCKYCDFKCFKNQHYIQHLKTKKHSQCAVNGVENSVNETEKTFLCICGKKYKDRSGLWRHKQTCDGIINKNSEENIQDDNSVILNISETEKDDKLLKLEDFTDKQLIMQLLTQNQELQKTIIELTKQGINNYNSNNNINNSNNKTFNLQVFLNEKCKNAMNINDFVSSIKPTLEDLENVGRLGYVEGISKIIINKLNNTEITERPIHCSDLKREVLYIKNDNVWSKESEDMPLLTKAIKEIANENIKNISEWAKANPGCTMADSKKNDLYLNIVSNSMCGLTKEETCKNIGKIISKVSKKVAITDCK
jgi:hypothetical protein